MGNRSRRGNRTYYEEDDFRTRRGEQRRDFETDPNRGFEQRGPERVSGWDPADYEENYFGGGSQQYGTGYRGGPVRRSRTFRDDPPISGREGRGGYRDDTGYRSGDRGRHEHSGVGWGGYYESPDYPESERGFFTDRERRERYDADERTWWNRAADEVSSWFGDEEAEKRRDMDAHRINYRGRGPRNYQRSDQRIEEDVNDRLTDFPYIDASDIEVSVGNRDVILSGYVKSRYEKRLAESIAEDVSGVSNVENRIRISRATPQQTGGERDTPTPEENTEKSKSSYAGQS
jgi:osmotically-inducible protein OsmY